MKKRKAVKVLVWFGLISIFTLVRLLCREVGAESIYNGLLTGGVVAVLADWIMRESKEGE